MADFADEKQPETAVHADVEVSKEEKEVNQGDGDVQEEMEGEGVEGEAQQRPDHFTSEIFKIKIENLHHAIATPQLKQFLAKHKLPAVKVAKSNRNDFAFVTFHNEEERAAAIALLNSGIQIKGLTIKASKAEPKADPYFAAQKREQEGNVKRRKIDNEEQSLPPHERLADKVTSLWRLSYEEQLATKKRDMEQAIRKVGKLLSRTDNAPSWIRETQKANKGMLCGVQDVIPSPVLVNYRNKCEFTVGPDLNSQEKTVGFTIGSYSEGTVEVVEPDQCLNVDIASKNIASAFQKYIRQSSWPAYDRLTHSGQWRQLTVRTSQLGDTLAAIMFHPQKLTTEEIEQEKGRLKEWFEARKVEGLTLHSLLLQSNTTVSGAAEDSEWVQSVFGDQFLHEQLLGLKFRVSVQAFFQVNALGAERLLTIIREWCDLKDNPIVLDICCGTGTIGISLAKDGTRVIGVEMCAEAVEDAKVNAKLNGIENLEYHVGKAEDVLPPIIKQLPASSEIIGIVDPPRAGLHNKVVQAIRKCEGIKRLIYVSCNPNAIGQNITDFCKAESNKWQGRPFILRTAIPVDMFPQTPHCELLLLLTRD